MVLVAFFNGSLSLFKFGLVCFSLFLNRTGIFQRLSNAGLDLVKFDVHVFGQVVYGFRFQHPYY